MGRSAPVGTAQAGSDFTQLPENVTIPANQSQEVEDEHYNETDPGLYLLLNDDDDEDGVIDGWESAPPGEDDEMVQAVLSFQSDEKIIGVSPNEQEAEVTLSLSSPACSTLNQ